MRLKRSSSTTVRSVDKLHRKNDRNITTSRGMDDTKEDKKCMPQSTCSNLQCGCVIATSCIVHVTWFSSFKGRRRELWLDEKGERDREKPLKLPQNMWTNAINAHRFNLRTFIRSTVKLKKRNGTNHSD